MFDKSFVPSLVLGATVLVPFFDSTNAAELNDIDIPAGMVTFFETESCPDGWTEPEYARGRLLMFDRTSQSATPIGTPMAAGVAPVHNHRPLTATVELPAQEIKGGNGCSNDTPVQAGVYHYADYSAITPSDLNLPFIHLTACEKRGKNPANDPLPLETFGFFNRDSCPAQWEICDPPVCPSITRRFALPLVPGGRTGLVTGEPWHDSSRHAAHRHHLSGIFELKPYGVIWFLGDNSRAASGQRKLTGVAGLSTHSVDHSTDLLPYVRLLGCIKTGLVAETANRVPTGMTIFHGGQTNCPGGWHPTPKSEGRFVVASPSGARPFQEFGSSVPLARDGETRSHTHAFSTNLVLEGSNLCLNGGGEPNLGSSGPYRVTGRTDPMVVNVPYVQLRQCTIQPKSEVRLDPGAGTDPSSNPDSNPGRSFESIPSPNRTPEEKRHDDSRSDAPRWSGTPPSGPADRTPGYARGLRRDHGASGRPRRTLSPGGGPEPH